ncbi:MAG: hypothetical protein ACK56F_30615, partial [bacterium]
GKHRALARHHHARTQARSGLAALRVAEKPPKHRIVEVGMIGRQPAVLGGVDVHHGRSGPGGCIGI